MCNEFNIDILCLQETHVNVSTKEVRKEYTWYFGGNEGAAGTRTYAGVAVVVSNDLVNYIHNIVPINDRLMYVVLGYGMPVTLINVYVPTAEHETETKENLYARLAQIQSKQQNKGPTYVFIIPLS